MRSGQPSIRIRFGTLKLRFDSIRSESNRRIVELSNPRSHVCESSLLHILALSARTKSMNFETMKKNCPQTIQTHHRNGRLILGSCIRPMVETANVWEYKLHRRMEGATKRGEVGEVTFLRISAPSWESCPRWKKWQNFSRKFYL
jgi:hypothetical protein